MLQFVWSKNFKRYYLGLEFPARMYLLVKLLRKHKHKFTFDKQVRACNSGYIHSSNMDNSLESGIASTTCGTTCGAMEASAQWEKRKRKKFTQTILYILLLILHLYVCILVFFELCYRRSKSACVYLDKLLEQSLRAYNISCLMKESKFTSSEIPNEPEKFKFEIV